MAGLLAGGSLQEGTFIGVQHFERVCVLPNANHLPLLGPTAALDGTLEKKQRTTVSRDRAGPELLPSSDVCSCFLSSVRRGRAQGRQKMFLEEKLSTKSHLPNSFVSGMGSGGPEDHSVRLMASVLRTKGPLLDA